MENISTMLEIVTKILAAFCVGALAYVIPKIRAFFVGKIGAEKTEELEKLVRTFVKSAEQCLKEDDPTGQKRKEYVENCLTEMEVEITDYINAVIEKEVFNLKERI